LTESRFGFPIEIRSGIELGSVTLKINNQQRVFSLMSAGIGCKMERKEVFSEIHRVGP
jgi:hypothetical protein